MNMTPKKTCDDQDEHACWLALYRAPQTGSSRILGLIDSFGSATAIFKAGNRAWQDANLPQPLRNYLQQPDWQAVEQDLHWLNQAGNRILPISDSAYPAMLKEIPDPPALLFTHGDAEILSQPQLAIVGSRNPSHHGAALAQDFAHYLASCGLTICSGLALGVDAAAHLGSLEAGGFTVAVTGTGLDRVYPAQHRALAHRIADHGVLVSEFLPGTPPLAHNFPRRNRIISGLSVGTLVIEAALRSGSLITARTALEQGREVFAIPGSIHNPLARGCHALIREGAKLVESGQHVLEELEPLIRLSLSALNPPPSAEIARNSPVSESGKTADLTQDYRQLLDSMGYEPVSVDELVLQSGLTAEQLSSMLLLLELDGHISSSVGGRYVRSL